MNNNSMQTPGPRDGLRGLWSRFTSTLRWLIATDEPTLEASGILTARTTRNASRPGAGAAAGTVSDRFANQLYANLLKELPLHRQAFTAAWLADDRQALADCTHRLAGAVAYCNLPELGAALDDLESAIRRDDEQVLPRTYNRASREIDELLESSGLRQAR
jgi:HPt (histidine-containing phosphotransfer) domain-containing protein